MTMTKLALASLLLAEIFCLGIISGLEWESVPDDFLYACTGSKVTFPWRFKVTQGESVSDVHWNHHGALSSEMVAMMAHGHFLPTQGYSARAHHVGNGGFVLEDLLEDDTGNYTVEVNVDKQGSFQSFQHSVYLQVADGLMVQGGQLKAEQDPEARWEESSQQWQIRLTCGFFTFLGPPSVDVTWTTPEGQAKPSSGYESGHYYLSLVTPVQGGNYTCTIPPVRLPDVCYREQKRHDIMAASAAVMVDEMKTRLSLLEANLRTVRKDNQRLTTDQKTLQDRLQQMEQAHEEDVENVTEYCQDMRNRVQQQIENLEDTQRSLMDNVTFLMKDIHPGVMTGPCLIDGYQELRDDWRSTDEGKGNQCDMKNLKPGWYRFFLDGANAVIPTSCVPSDHCTTHASQWLDLQGQSLPVPGHEREARVCSHYVRNCCWQKSPIVVRNCGSYFVYKISPLSSCNHAICAERQK